MVVMIRVMMFKEQRMRKVRFTREGLGKRVKKRVRTVTVKT